MEDLLLARVCFRNTIIFLFDCIYILLLAMHNRVNLVFFK